jgi:hypothetical protein
VNGILSIGYITREAPNKKATKCKQICLFLREQLEYFYFFPESNIRLYDKNSESDYVFFSPPKSEYFFQQHWESEYFF